MSRFGRRGSSRDSPGTLIRTQSLGKEFNIEDVVALQVLIKNNYIGTVQIKHTMFLIDDGRAASEFAVSKFPAGPNQNRNPVRRDAFLGGCAAPFEENSPTDQWVEDI